MQKFTFKGREFGLTVIKEGDKLKRVVITDSDLEFPSPTPEKAVEFLVDEFGGDPAEAMAVMVATGLFDGLEISNAVSTIAPDKKKKKSAAKAPKVTKEAKPVKEPKAPKAPKVPKEVVMETFELSGKTVEKKLQVKTILPGQVPESTQDIDLDTVYGLHIDIYSKKNRTSKLFVKETGEVVIENVSLMDVIFAYASKTGMTFSQADKYIKVKRGLIQESVPKEKKEKAVFEKKAKKTVEASPVDDTPTITATSV